MKTIELAVPVQYLVETMFKVIRRELLTDQPRTFQEESLRVHIQTFVRHYQYIKDIEPHVHHTAHPLSTLPTLCHDRYRSEAASQTCLFRNIRRPCAGT